MEEVIKKIEQVLKTGFPTERTWEWLLDHLLREVEKNKKSRERYKEYFEENKERLYKYHREYRKKHPEYEIRRRERARQKSRTRTD